MGKPNLFNYATSELSQDAFLCWLLSWGTPEANFFDKNLHELSRRLLQAFFAKHDKEIPIKIEKLEIKRQYRNIDILVIINDSIAILIEDKLQSREHSNQLSRYLQILKNDGFSEENLLPIYLQTGEQGDYKKVKETGFSPLLRPELLNVLKSGTEHSDNNILKDYLAYLENVETQVQSFKRLQLDQWNWYSWQGFYNYLQENLNDGEWDYVPNASGGFLGFWWHVSGDDECEQYLQLEKNKLCFKIAVANRAKQTDLKWKWNERILKAAENSELKVIKPVLRNGQWMTVAVVDGDYLHPDKEGIIDLEKAVFVLQEAQRIIDKATAI